MIVEGVRQEGVFGVQLDQTNREKFGTWIRARLFSLREEDFDIWNGSGFVGDSSLRQETS